MMGVKPRSAMYPQVIKNEADKKFSTSKNNSKTLGKEISFPGYILKQFGHCFIESEHTQFSCQNERFAQVSISDKKNILCKL